MRPVTCGSMPSSSRRGASRCVWPMLGAPNRDVTAFHGGGLLIHEGRVVLTGTVDTETLHRDAVALARKVDGVREIYDHVRVDPNSGVADYADDSRIVASMRRAIILDKSILSLNYDIDASAHTLYLLGIAQDEGERQRVLAQARTISGVRSVVDYIRIKIAAQP